MAKAKESLEEGLDRSASKRHLTGAARHRYIGGALHNMGKSKPRSGGKGKAKAASTSTASHKVTHKPVAPVKPVRPAVRIVLIARKNTEASKNKPYDVYSVYKQGEKAPYKSQTFRKMSAAKAEAKILQDEHNEGYARKRF